MIDVQNYVVTRDVALRTGDIKYKYRTEDGRFVVDNRTLSKIKFTSDEIINGLKGVEKITNEEAKELIAKGGYKMGDSDEVTMPKQKEQVEEQTPKEATEKENNEEKTEE